MPRQTFALSLRSVERRGDGWYHGLTNGDDRDNYRGPYSSLISVALMMAREIVREALRRQERLATPATPAE